MKSLTRALLAATTLLATPAMAAAPADVLGTYSDIAFAKYSDSLETAKTLQGAIDKLIAEPTDANLAEARKAWVEARNPYQQTEAYRFGNAIVDVFAAAEEDFSAALVVASAFDSVESFWFCGEQPARARPATVNPTRAMLEILDIIFHLPNQCDETCR